MSPSASASAGHVTPRSVSQALRPFSDHLINDPVAFMRASLTLARSTLDGQAPFNQASPQRKAALTALARWRGHVHGAQTSVHSVSSHAKGHALAVQWLTTLDTALALADQALTLSDPHAAAVAAAHAQQHIDASHALADRIAQVIG